MLSCGGPARPEVSPESPWSTWKCSLLWTPENWGSPFWDLAHPPWLNAKAPGTRRGSPGQVHAGNQGWYAPPEGPVRVHPSALRPPPAQFPPGGETEAWGGLPRVPSPTPRRPHRQDRMTLQRVVQAAHQRPLDPLLGADLGGVGGVGRGLHGTEGLAAAPAAAGLGLPNSPNPMRAAAGEP